MMVNDQNVPLRWPGNPAVVRIFPDSGGLGPMSAEAAHAALLFSAEQWSTVPSAAIRLEDAGSVGSVAGPEGPGDFTAENVFDFIGVNNGGVSPIIFDNQDDDANGNGDIFDLLGLDSGVLGITLLEFVEDTTIIEGAVLFNGATVDPADSEGTFFRGVFTHELGHLLNLGHTVVNGQAIYFGGSDAVAPDGNTMAVEPEDLETMYPFGDPTPNGAARWQATLHRDDIAALSSLYPAAQQPLSAFGSIRGRLLGPGSSPKAGGQIIARNQQGDPYQDAVSAISGDAFQVEGEDVGTYLLNGLTPGGRYSLELRDTVAGAFSAPVFTSPGGLTNSDLGLLPGPEEYFSGFGEASQNPPDSPTSHPFLISVSEGGPDDPWSADIKLNEFSPPDNDTCSDARGIRASSLPFTDFRQTSGATGGDFTEPPAFAGSGWIRGVSGTGSRTTLTKREISCFRRKAATMTPLSRSSTVPVGDRVDTDLTARAVSPQLGRPVSCSTPKATRIGRI